MLFSHSHALGSPAPEQSDDICQLVCLVQSQLLGIQGKSSGNPNREIWLAHASAQLPLFGFHSTSISLLFSFYGTAYWRGKNSNLIPTIRRFNLHPTSATNKYSTITCYPLILPHDMIFLLHHRNEIQDYADHCIVSDPPPLENVYPYFLAVRDDHERPPEICSEIELLRCGWQYFG